VAAADYTKKNLEGFYNGGTTNPPPPPKNNDPKISLLSRGPKSIWNIRVIV